MSGRVDAAGGARWAKRLPGAALSEWVAVIWYSADNRGGRTRERLLPRGTVELVTELGPEHTSIIGPDRRIDVDPVSVVGASPRPFVLDRPNRFETIGATFRPGGAVALLGVSADELDGAPLPLGLLWGAAAAELRERATAATGPDEKLAAVEHVLAEQLPHVERARRERIHPYVETDDLDASRSFYTEIFGLQVTMETPVLGLQAPDLPSAQVIVCPRGFETPQADFGIDVGDPEAVDQAHARVHDRNLRVVYPLTDEPWGVRWFFVEEPDGHIINVLAHPPDAT